MTITMRITVLVENTARGAGLLAEHGIAWWLEFDGHHVLFDTGQGKVLSANADQLGVPLNQTDAIILSHGHYDHTGGLKDVLESGAVPDLYAHPAAFRPKYAHSRSGKCRDVGIPPACLELVQTKANNIIDTEQPTTVYKQLTVTGSVPRTTTFEKVSSDFFLDADCTSPDQLLDDQAVFFESTDGTVILLGCAHAGVINTIKYIQQLTNQKPVCMVLGGMHLVAAAPERIHWTIDQLKTLGIKQLAPMHCTGMAATASLWEAFPGTFVQCPVGTRLEFKIDGP